MLVKNYFGLPPGCGGVTGHSPENCPALPGRQSSLNADALKEIGHCPALPFSQPGMLDRSLTITNFFTNKIFLK